MEVIDIRYKGKTIAALSHKEGEKISRFEYTKDAVVLGIEFSSLKMPGHINLNIWLRHYSSVK